MSTPGDATTPRSVPADDAVAWKLAAAARPHLNRADADRIFVAIGVGDGFDAIDTLLSVIVEGRLAVSDELVATVSTWLDGYRGHTDEPRLRDLLTHIGSLMKQQHST